MLAANFDDGDLFITLTYEDGGCPRAGTWLCGRYALSWPSCGGPEGQGPAHQIHLCDRGRLPRGRLHHHLVLNGTGEDLEEVRRLWIYGSNVEMTRLKFDRGHTYEDLAAYLTKEPREWGHPQVGERTWTPSLGLDRPEPQTERVPDCVTLTAPPEAEVLANGGPGAKRLWGIRLDQVHTAKI